jgi:hypothetical protein
VTAAVALSLLTIALALRALHRERRAYERTRAQLAEARRTGDFWWRACFELREAIGKREEKRKA